jgi:hypothetical protein
MNVMAATNPTRHTVNRSFGYEGDVEAEGESFASTLAVIRSGLPAANQSSAHSSANHDLLAASFPFHG